MAEYIEREALLKEVDDLKKSPWYNDDYGFGTKQARHDGVNCVVDLCIKQAPAADVVEVVRCKDCKHATELDKHCEINRTAYKHCSLLRGEETKYVWHKYKKYYKDYSLVELDEFCSFGERSSDND